ncbi:MAG: methyltransferase domain-containing protein [Patescibacteria group bacterium]|nr:methyltransferase domain-containing protein [Patescibacteria group bacterium]
MDRIKTEATDIIHDLDIRPYPFADNSVAEIMADNVLEHVASLLPTMEEIHRILEPNGIIKIRVPYAKSDAAFKDPTHKNFFTEDTFSYFSDEHYFSFYSRVRFKVEKVEFYNYSVDWRHRLRNLLPGKKLLKIFLFNIYDEIYFELRCLK